MSLIPSRPGLKGPACVTRSAVLITALLAALAPTAAAQTPKYFVVVEITLVVALLNPSTRNRLLRMRVDQPIDTEPDKLVATINRVVAQTFERYPTRRKR